jgi:hypothetical protein
MSNAKAKHVFSPYIICSLTKIYYIKEKIMAKVYFKDTDDPFDIRYDNVFKAVFTKDTPAAKGALSKLVSALICKDVSIITIVANEPSVYFQQFFYNQFFKLHNV